MKNTSVLFLIALVGAIVSVLTLIVAIATKSYILIITFFYVHSEFMSKCFL